jgi:hypothetical protein
MTTRGGHVEPHEVESIIRHLAAAIEHQRTINEDLREFTRQQVAINADVRTTLARIETLIARMLPTGENGREA